MDTSEVPVSAVICIAFVVGAGIWTVVASDLFELPFSYILKEEIATKKMAKTLLLKIAGMLQSQMEKCDGCPETKRFSAKHNLFY
jgi:hypothetical protein